MPTPDSAVRLPRLLTVRQTAEVLGIQKFRIYQMLRDGLPHLKIGKTYRIPEDALAKYIQEQAEASVR